MKNKIVLDGKEMYLKYTLNSMRILEKRYNVKLQELGESFDMEKIQALLHVGLLSCEPNLTFEEVGDMVDMQNIQEVVNAITGALGGLPQ